MSIEKIKEIAAYVSLKGSESIKTSTEETDFILDYVAIFSKHEDEFQEMLKCIQHFGEEVDKVMQKTGRTFKLREPIETEVGKIKFLKIRKPDYKRPQRGAPDFIVKDYFKTKEKYFGSSGDFTLMPHTGVEMIELKGDDVLVYLKEEAFKAS